MKYQTTKGVLFAVMLIIFTSCSMTKRLYMPGYHSEWHTWSKGDNNVNNSIKRSMDLDDSYAFLDLSKAVPFERLIASSEFRADFILENLEESSDVLEYIDANKMEQQTGECDIIVFKTGDEVEAIVTEVGINEIRYKRCDNPQGPTFVKSKAEVFMIKHSNDTKTVFNETPQASDSRSKTSSSVNENVTSGKSKTESTSNKNIGVAVLLWFFLGLLGIHRFYLGHTGMGILYLLTGALCGIGWFIDGLLFLTGSLKP